MRLQNVFQLPSLFLMMVFFLAFPLLKFLFPPTVIVLGLIGIAKMVLGPKSSGNNFNGYNSLSGQLSLLPVLFYVLYIIGSFYSNYLDSALVDLRIKSIIFFLPAFFLFPKFVKSFYPGIRKIMTVFTSGIVSYLLLCLIRAALLYLQTKDLNVFVYVQLSPFEHTTYVAMLSICSIVWLLFKDKDSLSNAWLRYGTLVFLMLSVVLLSSRLGIISMVFVFVTFLVSEIFFRKKFKQAGIIGAIGVLGILFVFKEANVDHRLQRLVESSKNMFDGDQKKASIQEPRYIIWQTAVQVAKKHPYFGYGTGSTREEMTKYYKEHDLESFYIYQWNAHNQFLQTYIALGVPGLLLLSLSLFLPIFYCRKRELLFISVMAFVFAFNCLSESVLELQTGVCLYALIICLASRERYLLDEKKALI